MKIEGREGHGFVKITLFFDHSKSHLPMRRHLLRLFLTQVKQNPKIVFDIYRFHNLVIAQTNIDHLCGPL